MKRRFIKFILRIVMKIVVRSNYEGLEHIPPEGKVIITTNHMSRLDVTLLLFNPVRPEITAVVGAAYKSHPVIGFLVNWAGAIWIDRTRADLSAFREALEVLKDGGVLGIAIEGTRSRVGSLIEGKPGAALFAIKSGTPIVPVGISGTEDAVRSFLRGRRSLVTACFGPSFTLPQLDRDNRDKDLQRFTDEIMCRIAALLPDKYHGHYAGNPRIKEIQEGKLDF